MAKGDAVVALGSIITTTSYQDLQPAGTVEWIIHEIYCAADCEIYWYDGSNQILLDTTPTTGRWYSNLTIHCTNAMRIRIKNINAASKYIGYAGIISHA